MEQVTRALLATAEGQPVDWDTLRRMLAGEAEHTKLVLYDDLHNVRSLDALFGTKRNIILWMNIKGHGTNTSGHWVGLMRFPDHIEHFDSYGLTVDQELAITHERPYLGALVNNSRTPVRQSTARLQSRVGHVNTCGRWVVARIKQRVLRLEEFVAFYSGVGIVPDAAVALATLLL